MLKIYIGQNASGKTLLLKRTIDACDESFSSNIDEVSVSFVSESIMSEERINILKGILMSGKISLMGHILVCTDSAYDIGDQFMRIATIICQNVNNVFLDEPEIGLSREEVNLLSEFLTVVVNSCNVNVYITTHNISLTNIKFGECVYQVDKSGDEFNESLVEEHNIEEVLDSI